MDEMNDTIDRVLRKAGELSRIAHLERVIKEIGEFASETGRWDVLVRLVPALEMDWKISIHNTLQKHAGEHSLHAAFPLLIEAMRTEGFDAILAESALVKIAEQRPFTLEELALLKGAMTDGSPSVRAGCVNAICRDKIIVQDWNGLSRLCRHEDPAIAAAALSSLVHLRTSHTRMKKAIRLMTMALGSEHPEVVKAALGAMANLAERGYRIRERSHLVDELVFGDDRGLSLNATFIATMDAIRAGVKDKHALIDDDLPHDACLSCYTAVAKAADMGLIAPDPEDYLADLKSSRKMLRSGALRVISSVTRSGRGLSDEMIAELGSLCRSDEIEMYVNASTILLSLATHGHDIGPAESEMMKAESQDPGRVIKALAHHMINGGRWEGLEACIVNGGPSSLEGIRAITSSVRRGADRHEASALLARLLDSEEIEFAVVDAIKSLALSGELIFNRRLEDALLGLGGKSYLRCQATYILAYCYLERGDWDSFKALNKKSRMFSRMELAEAGEELNRRGKDLSCLIPFLASRLKGRKDPERLPEFRLLSEILGGQDPTSNEKLLSKMNEEGNAGAAIAAAQALAKAHIRSEDGEKVLRLLRHRRRNLAKASLSCITQMPESLRALEPQLKRMLRFKDREVRLQAAIILAGSYPSLGMHEEASELLMHSDPVVREGASMGAQCACRDPVERVRLTRIISNRLADMSEATDVPADSYHRACSLSNQWTQIKSLEIAMSSFLSHNQGPERIVDEATLPQPFTENPQSLPGPYHELEAGFDAYLRSKGYPVAIPGHKTLRLVNSAIAQTLTVPWMESAGFLEQIGISSLMIPDDVFSWSAHPDVVESAQLAAAHIAGDYDIGVGIARRGLWLSYMFSRSGLLTRDVLVKRSTEGCLAIPIDEMDHARLGGCRVLLFDNDAVTGSSVIAAARYLMDTIKPESIDLLMIYRYARMESDSHEIMERRLAPGQTLGRERAKGRMVLDVMSQIPRSLFRKRMTLEQDFRPKGPLRRKATGIQG